MSYSSAGAELIVFPEYAGMELAGLSPQEDLATQTVAAAEAAGRAHEHVRRLSARTGAHILAGSGPVREGDRLVNRAVLVSPSGAIGRQDKRILTPWERSHWTLSPGRGARVFETPLGRLGVLICYDAEFPLLARGLVEAGAEIVLVPACTDGVRGSSRVHVAAAARALEGQCVTVVSALTGAAPWCGAIDVNIGRGAIYGPPDTGFPPDGVIARGEDDAPGWVVADVDLGAVAEVRARGEVRPMAHWTEQESDPAEVTPLA